MNEPNQIPANMQARIIPFHATTASQERREMRLVIKRADLTRSQRDILQAVVNLWFRHRADERVIRPGREKLAKAARSSVRTVTRSLSEFQDRGFITAISYASGGAKATRFTVDLTSIRRAFEVGFVPESAPGTLNFFASVGPRQVSDNTSENEALANDSPNFNPGQNGPRKERDSQYEQNQLSPRNFEGNEDPSQEDDRVHRSTPPPSNVIPFRNHRINSWLGSSLMFDTSSPRQLRPHQQTAIDLLRNSLRQGNKRVVLQASTGFGKTITAAKIIEAALAKRHRVLFTVPRLSLVGQTIAEFEREGIIHIGAMQANHPRTDDSAPVQVATVQTLKHRLKRGAMSEDFGLVIVDECHEDFTVIREMMVRWPDRPFVGLSATPWTRGLGRHWQDLCIAATIESLIADGYLSQFSAYAPDKPDLSGVRTVAGEYAENDLERVMADGKLVGHVVATWLEMGENRPTLVFGVNCAHAQRLQAEFMSAGVSAGYCDAYTDSVARDHLKRQFISGDVKVACSVRTLTTGVDWPVSCIVDAAPTKSEMLHVQRIGRGLRVNPGTEDLIILDHAGNSLRLGLVTDIYHDKLDTGTPGKPTSKPKAKKLPKECSACGALHTGLRCPQCGHERKAGCDVETVDGRLIEITGRGKAPTHGEKQRFWSMALDLDDHRKRGGKLALGLYKGKYGVWPRGLIDVRIPFDAAFQRYEQSRRIAWAKSKAKLRGAA